MSRTVRRPSRHLIQWWLPDGEIAIRQRNPWHEALYPGRLKHLGEPDIVRILQTNNHGFFCGVGRARKKQKAKQVRQRSRCDLQHAIRSESHDAFLNPFVVRRYD